MAAEVMRVRVRDAVGRFGEDVAVRHLSQAGLQVVDRNWRCAEGEIDIVARDGSVLVVCEVKTRSSGWFGSPVEAVNWEKRRRLRRLALRWLAEHDSAYVEVRFDVVGVVRRPVGRIEVVHLSGVF